jgi:uncharacterized damage-inducible protein DinB
MLGATLEKLIAYRAWADELTFSTVNALPSGEAGRPRATRWESITYTLSHVLVVDDIFKHHLEGRRHGYTYRNMDVRLGITELWERQRGMNRWYADFAAQLDLDGLAEVVRFEFVGGGQGEMTRSEILLHVVNHGTYHRGLISDMLCQVPADMPANDLPVFLRDAVASLRQC